MSKQNGWTVKITADHFVADNPRESAVAVTQALEAAIAALKSKGFVNIVAKDHLISRKPKAEPAT